MEGQLLGGVSLNLNSCKTQHTQKRTVKIISRLLELRLLLTKPNGTKSLFTRGNLRCRHSLKGIVQHLDLFSFSLDESDTYVTRGKTTTYCFYAFGF